MTAVHAYNVFGYRKADETGDNDVERRGVPEWRLSDALKWALGKGCDTVMVELTGTVSAHPGVTHHLCDDPACPGGCD